MLQADLVLSLDVIFHLVEDDVFQTYMQNVFSTAREYVIIYSSDSADSSAGVAAHVRHRKFTDYVKKECKGWKLVHSEENPYAFDGDDPINTSFAQFFVYQKTRVASNAGSGGRPLLSRITSRSRH